MMYAAVHRKTKTKIRKQRKGKIKRHYYRHIYHHQTTSSSHSQLQLQENLKSTNTHNIAGQTKPNQTRPLKHVNFTIECCWIPSGNVLLLCCCLASIYWWWLFVVCYFLKSLLYYACSSTFVHQMRMRRQADKPPNIWLRKTADFPKCAINIIKRQRQRQRQRKQASTSLQNQETQSLQQHQQRQQKNFHFFICTLHESTN